MKFYENDRYWFTCTSLNEKKIEMLKYDFRSYYFVVKIRSL